METTELCTVEDEFIFEKLRWVVSLSNDTVVYQDDGRPGCNPSSAWLRLKRWIESHDLDIVRMKFQFRSHIVSLPSPADGYYFSKGVYVTNVTGLSRGFYVGGVLVNDCINVQLWSVPELEILSQETRPINKDTMEKLIVNPSVKTKYLDRTNGKA